MKGLKKNRLVIAVAMLILSIGFSLNLYAQNNFWETKTAYLAQHLPGDTPRIFGQGILADSGIVLGRVAFSKDGKAFYYGFAKHWFNSNGSGVKEIVFDGKQWTKPTIIAEELSCPTFATDETKLYLGGKNSAVWQMEKTNGRWDLPKLFLQTTYGLYNFMPANSGVFYVGSNANAGSKHDYSTYDFCTLSINATDTIIKSLGKPLNTPAFDGDFYIAPDESYIIISAKETKTYECELWISFRKKDGSWTNPKSLGPLINTGRAHRFGQYVSPDGKYLFYTKGTSEKDCHFYWVRFDRLLKKLRAGY
jgi:hypothetical protein